MQTNHIHLIIEADHNDTLTKGMRSLTVTFAKGLKKGKVQLERYHLHVLRSLKETKNAIQYVLFNQQKHDQTKISVIDEFTSLLQLECGLDLIRNFCKKSFITLKINRCEKWTLGVGKSYLATQGLKLLL